MSTLCNSPATANCLQPTSILSLPPELLGTITENLPFDSLLAICRVSKLFHSLTYRSIYCNISLHTAGAVATCCRTLSTKSHYSSSVKSLTISYSPDGSPSSTSSAGYYHCLRGAFADLKHLQELRLMVYDPSYIISLESIHFPDLRHFESYLALTEPLVLFLNRHPSITYLQTAPNEALESPLLGTGVPRQLHLPNLEYFVGNAECVSAVEGKVPLKAAFMIWDAVDSAPEEALMALAESSAHSLNLVSCRRRGWNQDILQQVSLLLPNIRSLNVTNMLIVDKHPSEEYLGAIREALSRFTELRQLNISCLDMWAMNQIRCNLDKDFSTVTMFGEACPTLTECTLPHSDGLKWVRMQDLWIPDPSDARGHPWTFRMFSSGRYSQWKHLMPLLRGNVFIMEPLSEEPPESLTDLHLLSTSSSSYSEVVIH